MVRCFKNTGKGPTGLFSQSASNFYGDPSFDSSQMAQTGIYEADEALIIADSLY